MAGLFEDEWDKSTSEIQSEDSDDLHENRPNRWRGPSQSWRTITEEERLTYNAFVRLRNEDLSLHLYNAWKLRQRARRTASGEGSSQEEVRLTFPILELDVRDTLTSGFRMLTQRRANLSVTTHGHHLETGLPGLYPRESYRRMIS